MKYISWKHFPVIWLLIITAYLDSDISIAADSDSQSFEATESLFNNFDEVNGLILDRTMTRLGDDFYFFFAQFLNEHHADLTENLTIKERPTALSGSIISVYHSRNIIYRTSLSPGRYQAKLKAKQAVREVGRYVIRWEAERLLQDTFDLAHEEF